MILNNFTAKMPESAPAEARRSIGEALVVAATSGDNALAQVARTAFAQAMSGTFVVSAAAVLGSAVIALALLRDKKKTADREPVGVSAE